MLLCASWVIALPLACCASAPSTHLPEHRNHGYGRRLTYEVTAVAMARPDVDRAMLFTDAGNPVSNSIYRQAGYQPRGEHVEIEFAKRKAALEH